jgi:hypothetical protein
VGDCFDGRAPSRNDMLLMRVSVSKKQKSRQLI